MTSQACAACGARNWAIYQEGRILVIRCGDCDQIAWDAQVLGKVLGQHWRT